MEPRRKRITVIFAVGISVGFAVFFLLALLFNPPPAENVTLGVTFSDKYAVSLGLDWREVYISILDDIGVRKFRIPVYWDQVEKKSGVYDWSDVDWMLEEAGKRGAEVILAIGHKTPRWPECHTPKWAKILSEEELQQRVLRIVRREVEHFKDFDNVTLWQVENEPLFHFGDCPPPDREFLKEEIDLVRSLDDRSIMVTDSGELSTWVRTASLGDVLGISMYRLVWNKNLGFLFWPLTPRYYSERIVLVKKVVDRVIISELQAEPWFRGSFDETSLEEQFETMNLPHLLNTIDFAKRTGADEVYLWGVEWWYWLKEQGNTDFYTAARGLFDGKMR